MEATYPLCHKEPARSKQNTPLGVFCVPKPLVGGFGCDELVLYGIRELAQQFLGSNLDIEVDHSALRGCGGICRQKEEPNIFRT